MRKRVKDKEEKNLSRARMLRLSMTPQERKLWYIFLKRLPVNVYRQKPLGPYIVDFYCPSAELVIELDGEQHYNIEGEKKDLARSKYLEGLGLRVLRFTNTEIDNFFTQVTKTIENYILK